MGADYIERKNLAGVVVLYHPTPQVVTVVNSVIHSLSHLYLIDNSESADIELVNALCATGTNVSYHPLNTNLGIARALNAACNFAINDGFSWILTMDQDSFFTGRGFFDRVFNKQFSNTVIIAASFSQYFFKPKPSGYDGFLEVDFVITSGNLLNLHHWQQVGGFCEKMFIDEVDNEFCIRARNKGFIILATEEEYLSHNLGEKHILKNFFTGRESLHTVHSPVRIYYVIRNNVYIWRKFLFSNPGFVTNRIKNILVLMIRITLYFPDRKKYFKYIFEGIRDSIIGNYGKFIDK